MQQLVKYMQSDNVTKKLQEILGQNAQSFVSSALQAVSQNELLQKATGDSVYRAVMAAAVANLQINQNIGHAYIVPFKNNKTQKIEAQLQNL